MNKTLDTQHQHNHFNIAAAKLRVLNRVRHIYLTKFRWHFAEVGCGLYVEPLVSLVATKNMFFDNHVRLLRGCVIDAGTGQIRIGLGVAICRYTVLQALEGKITIGRGSVVGDFCSLYGQGDLSIGDNVQIASGCRFIPKTSRYNDASLLISEQGYEKKGIIIENDVWFGTNCVVLDGVTVGEGAVVGAGAVVTKDLPEYSVSVGVPARVIRMRK